MRQEAEKVSYCSLVRHVQKGLCPFFAVGEPTFAGVAEMETGCAAGKIGGFESFAAAAVVGQRDLSP